MLLASLLLATTDAAAQRVRQVIDGDTITVSGVGVVRLLGVDAPEKAGGYRQAERFGDEALRFMKQLVEGHVVRLEYDGPRRDQYKRTLAYVFLEDGTLVNEAIIRAGWAETYRRFDLVRKPAFLDAERDARRMKRGMWSKPEARFHARANGADSARWDAALVTQTGGHPATATCDAAQ